MRGASGGGAQGRQSGDRPERREARSLVAMAEELLRHDPATAGAWPRAVPVLLRQSLEESLDALWRRWAPGMEEAPRRAQLAALPEYLNDRKLAEDVAYVWWALSRACHAHPYELGPTAGELNGWAAVAHGIARIADDSGVANRRE